MNVPGKLHAPAHLNTNMRHQRLQTSKGHDL
jgi:hypothetical protein